ncbi:MAG: radical SAM protein [Anaerolineae bacterium]|nr:radical SAM protein [Anaerolineae bacterium]
MNCKISELAERVRQARSMLHECRLCGWNCGIDRAVKVGPCRAGMETRVATAYLHFGEERPLVGQGGSGAIFFSNCELSCRFCQTARWNIDGNGRELTARQLADVMVDLQRRGAVNINLVTPTHVAPQIVESLALATQSGLQLPLVWNSGGYDSLETLALLDGIVDIYLPDMKYSDASLGRRLSGIDGYPQVNRQAVAEMRRQVGDLVIDQNGVARRGVLVRHLVMPGHPENTTGVLQWIARNLGANTYLSLMDQYRPAYRAFEYEAISRPITPDEYIQARQMAMSLGLTRLDEHQLLDLDLE